MHDAAHLNDHPDLAPELQVVRHVLAHHLDRSAHDIVPMDRLHADLALGLLGLAVVALELEDVTGVLLPYEALTRAVTIEDLARLLHDHRRPAARRE
ncbi:MAG: hypothetical protein INH41_28760 [Myxococcaceae bacterium]|jgi:hypothetical protein|nr:hypothetical protein [Myxococcaceae bacterium]